MKANVEKALNEVDMTYSELISYANDILSGVIGDVNTLIESVYNNVENLTNDDIRTIMLKLSLRSYSFSELKDRALFKAELAETNRKSNYATAFSEATGTVAVKESVATLSITEEILAEELYDLVSNLFKTKLDEIHRVVDTLKVSLTTRLSEAKLVQVDTE